MKTVNIQIKSSPLNKPDEQKRLKEKIKVINSYTEHSVVISIYMSNRVIYFAV